MRKIIFLILFLVVLIVACSKKPVDVSKANHLNIVGSGHLVTRTIELEAFDRIDAGLAFEITIKQGPDYLVTVEADDNFIDFILVNQDGSQVNFDYKPGFAYDIAGVSTKATVVMPVLSQVKLASSAAVILEGLEQHETLKAELSGSSALIGNLRVKEAEFNLDGSSYVKLAGSTTDLKTDVCGSSKAELRDFNAQQARINVSCNGTVIINVDGRLDVEASQHALVYYKGHPSFVQNNILQFASVRALEPS